jgi:hypothetical protein
MVQLEGLEKLKKKINDIGIRGKKVTGRGGP